MKRGNGGELVQVLEDHQHQLPQHHQHVSLVRQVVRQHLKRRHYRGSEQVNTATVVRNSGSSGTTRSLSEFALDVACDMIGTGSKAGLIGLGLGSGTELLAAADLSFSSFCRLVSAHSLERHIKAELTELLLPLFTHYFIQLFENGHKQAGNYCAIHLLLSSF